MDNTRYYNIPRYDKKYFEDRNTYHYERKPKYEYLPMNFSYRKLDWGWTPAEGIGINSTGFMRGHVVIRAESPRKLFVSVFADTGSRKLAPSSVRHATITVMHGGATISKKDVTKNEPYIISSSDVETFLGSADFLLPEPTDPIPLTVKIEVNVVLNQYEGSVYRFPMVETVTIGVHRVFE